MSDGGAPDTAAIAPQASNWPSFCLLAAGGALLAWQNWVVARGNSYLDLEQLLGAQRAIERANTVAAQSVTIGAVASLFLWSMTQSIWRPTDRVQRAVRRAAWPAIFFAHKLGIPVVMHRAHSQPPLWVSGVGQAFAAFCAVALVGGMITFLAALVFTPAAETSPTHEAAQHPGWRSLSRETRCWVAGCLAWIFIVAFVTHFANPWRNWSVNQWARMETNDFVQLVALCAIPFMALAVRLVYVRWVR